MASGRRESHASSLLRVYASARSIHRAMTESGAVITRREHYPLRAADVAAIIAFWSALAIISAAGRELDPRIPDVPNRVMAVVVTTSYVEYALWAALTIPVWWLGSRFSIEGGRRLGRVALFLVIGLVIAI